jgi:ATP-dependent Clp protease ATP-binding subunit ClpA
MGARPMARVIQEHIKKPLADEVLFGKLKSGGHVKVILMRPEGEAEKLGFEFLDGPITPKPEQIPGAPKPKRVRRKSPKPKGGSGGPSSGRGSLPKVPLVRV